MRATLLVCDRSLETLASAPDICMPISSIASATVKLSAFRIEGGMAYGLRPLLIDLEQSYFTGIVPLGLIWII